MEYASPLNEVDILRRLCDSDPKRRLVITPIISPRQQFQPTSFDLRLGTEFLVIRSTKFEYLDLLQKEAQAELSLSDYEEFIHISPNDRFVLHPREFVLGCTLEYLRLPWDLSGKLEGKSTWGRMGLQVHSTAGYIDPGFNGAITFELQNVGRVPIPLYPGLLVAQVCFYEHAPSSIPYNSKAFAYYGGWPGLQGSRFFKRPDISILRKIHQQKSRRR